MQAIKLGSLKSWCKKSNRDFIASNRNFYCLPGDIAHKDRVTENSEIPLRRCNICTEYSILDFPSTKPQNPVAICPYIRNEKLAKEIKKVFHKDRVLWSQKVMSCTMKSCLRLVVLEL